MLCKDIIGQEKWLENWD